MAEQSTARDCKVTLGARVPETLLAALRERFDEVSTTAGGTRLLVLRVDQAATRALLTQLWDCGLAIHAMTWSQSLGRHDPLDVPHSPPRVNPLEGGAPLPPS